jgi:hypothetical protein
MGAVLVRFREMHQICSKSWVAVRPTQVLWGVKTITASSWPLATRFMEKEKFELRDHCTVSDSNTTRVVCITWQRLWVAACRTRSRQDWVFLTDEASLLFLCGSVGVELVERRINTTLLGNLRNVPVTSWKILFMPSSTTHKHKTLEKSRVLENEGKRIGLSKWKFVNLLIYLYIKIN